MKRLTLCTLAAALLFLAGFAPVYADSPAVYIVRWGDTISGIAARYGLRAAELAEANGLPWYSWVYVGQRLVIPGARPEPGAAYTVRAGDTLWEIAVAYGTTVRALMEANGLHSSWIYPGQQLVIPGPDSSTEAVDGWTGTIVKLPAGSQFGQYFQRDDGQRYDIGGTSDAVRDLIGEYAWSGATVKVWGTLFTGVPAASARHIEAERIEAVSGPAQSRNLSPFARATASSTLRSDRWGNYQSQCAVDGSPETSWVEGVAGPGEGQWLTLTFPDAVVVERVGLDVGYDRDAAIFAANNRIKRATLVFSNGEQVQAGFADQRGVQMVSLDHAVETTSVTVIIEEVYPSSKYDDTCLAEVQVWGQVR